MKLSRQGRPIQPSKQAITVYHRSRPQQVKVTPTETELLSREGVELLERLEGHLNGTATREHTRKAFELPPDSGSFPPALNVSTPQGLTQAYENRKVMTNGKTTGHF